MKNYETQVCIIGAGPAGVTTALFLAKQEIHSIIIDQATFPRHKPCADNVTSTAIRVLKELDPTLVPEMSEKENMWGIDGIMTYTPNGKKMQIDFKPLEPGTTEASCIGLPRIDMDYQLVLRAKKNPYVTVIENFRASDISRKNGRVTISNKKQDLNITTDMVVFATGSNSNITADFCGISKEPKHVGAGVRAYFENVKGIEAANFCELIISKDFLPGGMYLTPFKDGSVNVNVVVRSDVVQKKKLNLTKLMYKNLKEHPRLKDRFKDARQVGKTQGSSLFLGTKKRKISGDNYLLVGDAAGLIDLLSANGIPQAVLSGKIAAQHITECVKSQSFSAEALQGYDVAVYKRIENYIKASNLIAPFVANPIFLRLVLFFMNTLTKRFDKNQQIRDWLYDNDSAKKLKTPSFYYKIFFGIKNAESLN